MAASAIGLCPVTTVVLLFVATAVSPAAVMPATNPGNAAEETLSETLLATLAELLLIVFSPAVVVAKLMSALSTNCFRCGVLMFNRHNVNAATPRRQFLFTFVRFMLRKS